MELQVTTLDGKTNGSVTLKDEIFGLEVRQDILHRMVRYQQLKAMAGTHDVKNRSEGVRTGKKFVKQKGSGGARHGDRKAPQFRGGGRAFGPTPRSHAIELPKKVRALALRHALSAKARAGNLVVLDNLDMKEAKTAALKSQIARLGFGKNALVIDGDALNVGFALASSNLAEINLLPAVGANVYDILNHETLVLTRAAVEQLEGRFNG